MSTIPDQQQPIPSAAVPSGNAEEQPATSTPQQQRCTTKRKIIAGLGIILVVIAVVAIVAAPDEQKTYAKASMSDLENTVKDTYNDIFGDDEHTGEESKSSATSGVEGSEGGGGDSVPQIEEIAQNENVASGGGLLDTVKDTFGKFITAVGGDDNEEVADNATTEDLPVTANPEAVWDDVKDTTIITENEKLPTEPYTISGGTGDDGEDTAVIGGGNDGQDTATGDLSGGEPEEMGQKDAFVGGAAPGSTTTTTGVTVDVDTGSKSAKAKSFKSNTKSPTASSSKSSKMNLGKSSKSGAVTTSSPSTDGLTTSSPSTDSLPAGGGFGLNGQLFIEEDEEGATAEIAFMSLSQAEYSMSMFTRRQ